MLRFDYVAVCTVDSFDAFLSRFFFLKWGSLLNVVTFFYFGLIKRFLFAFFRYFVFKVYSIWYILYLFVYLLEFFISLCFI